LPNADQTGAIQPGEESPPLSATSFTGGVSDSRQRLLDAAAAEIGSKDWQRYAKEATLVPPSKRVSWCGIFAAWSMKQAGYDINWQLGDGIRPPLATTSDPKPGDIIYLGGENHHYGIIERIEGDTLYTIDGNSIGGKVARNKRSKKDVRLFFDVDAANQGSPKFPEQEVPSPVISDTNKTADWAVSGGRNARVASQDRQDLAGLDVQYLKFNTDLLAVQKSLAKATQKALEQMGRAPPLRFLVNPNKFSVKSQKIASDGNWTRNGPIIEFWGDDQDKISGSGQVAAFYAIDAKAPNVLGGGPGITRTARNASMAYQNFQSLWLIYKNNGGVYLPSDLSQQDRDITLSTVGSVYIYYDNILYLGSFDSFNVTEEATKPFTLTYDFEFTVRAAFLLEHPADFNYNTQTPDLKRGLTETPSIPIKRRV
jgi:hypothetical protein